MSKASEGLSRYWSLAAAALILGLVPVESLRSEPLRAFAAVLCVTLLVHSWLIQRKLTRTPRRVALFTLAFCLPILASVWLGMNVIRFYSYSPDSSRVYSAVTELQDVIVRCMAVLAAVVVLWAIVELAWRLAKPVSA